MAAAAAAPGKPDDPGQTVPEGLLLLLSLLLLLLS